jgi:hypothetical protein
MAWISLLPFTLGFSTDKQDSLKAQSEVTLSAELEI